MSVKSAAAPMHQTPKPPDTGKPAPRRVNSAWLRRVNAERLLISLQQAPGSSQRQLGLTTGLDKATVSTITTQLCDAGLVERRESLSQGRQGRPEIALEIPATAGIVLGVRLEPDRIDIAAADLAGRIIDRESVEGEPTPAGSLDRLAQAAERLIGRNAGPPCHAVGIGVPALIDETGHLVLGPNLRWRDEPIQTMAQERLPIRVLVDNDTKAAGLGERRFGSGRDIDDFIYVTGHSGVGGAVFIHGELYRGASSFAGEIGHVKVVDDGRLCGCGGHGCLEAYASEQALVRRLAEAGVMVGGAADIAQLAEAGNPIVLALLREAGDLFGRALAGTVNVLNPARIVMGGNLALITPYLLQPLRWRLQAMALQPMTVNLEITRSPLGADGVVLGGIALAMDYAVKTLLDGIIGARAHA